MQIFKLHHQRWKICKETHINAGFFSLNVSLNSEDFRLCCGWNWTTTIIYINHFKCTKKTCIRSTKLSRHSVKISDLIDLTYLNLYVSWRSLIQSHPHGIDLVDVGIKRTFISASLDWRRISLEVQIYATQTAKTISYEQRL